MTTPTKIELPKFIKDLPGTGWEVKNGMLYIGYENSAQTFEISNECANVLRYLPPSFSGEIIIW